MRHFKDILSTLFAIPGILFGAGIVVGPPVALALWLL